MIATVEAKSARTESHDTLDADAIYEERLRCSASPLYFITTYCKIYDPQHGDWIAFELWPEQIEVLDLMCYERLLAILKARQLGLSWLALAFALWLMLFSPIADILIFSRRDDEAVYLLGEERMRGMYKQLPDWLRCEYIDVDSAHEFKLSNGSVCRAFPTTAGDSYTASLVIVDEADLVPDLNRLMASVKPTIDAGGKLFLISRADKSRPQSPFKRIYRAARQSLNDFVSVFLPWWVRPERDEAWYAAKRAEIMERTGSEDELNEQYPATDEEALAPRSLDKRINPAWVRRVYDKQRGLPLPPDAPSIPGLQLYALPAPGMRYAGGADPAEGNPTSDDSALVFIEQTTGEEVAMLSGKYQPSTLAAHADKIGQYFNNAPVMVERNNHGHAVILWLRDNGRVKVLPGFDKKPGWHSTTKGKSLMYDDLADAIRDDEAIIHSEKTFTQITSIEGSTLRAPDGEMDDCADAFALAIQAAKRPQVGSVTRLER